MLFTFGDFLWWGSALVPTFRSRVILLSLRVFIRRRDRFLLIVQRVAPFVFLPHAVSEQQYDTDREQQPDAAADDQSWKQRSQWMKTSRNGAKHLWQEDWPVASPAKNCELPSSVSTFGPVLSSARSFCLSVTSGCTNQRENSVKKKINNRAWWFATTINRVTRVNCASDSPE